MSPNIILPIIKHFHLIPLILPNQIINSLNQRLLHSICFLLQMHLTSVHIKFMMLISPLFLMNSASSFHFPMRMFVKHITSSMQFSIVSSSTDFLVHHVMSRGSSRKSQSMMRLFFSSSLIEQFLLFQNPIRTS
jgi:hypothetical protein